MTYETIFPATIFVIIGIACLMWPRGAWKMSNFLWVEGGSPTDFAIAWIRISGIAIGILIGVAPR